MQLKPLETSTENVSTDKVEGTMDPLIPVETKTAVTEEEINLLAIEDLKTIRDETDVRPECTPQITEVAPTKSTTNSCTNDTGSNVVKKVVVPIASKIGTQSYVKKPVVPISPGSSLLKKNNVNKDVMVYASSAKSNRQCNETIAWESGELIEQTKLQIEAIKKADPIGVRARGVINDLLYNAFIVKKPDKEIEREKKRLLAEANGQLAARKIRVRKKSVAEKQSEVIEMKTEIEESSSIEVQTEFNQEKPKEEVDEILENLRNICPVCQKCFENEKKMQKHVNRFHRKKHSCKQCDKKYYSKAMLETHMKVHQDDFYFECSICNLRYKRKAGLRHHVIRAHSTAAPKYLCDYCGKGFHLKMDIGVHIEFTHMNVTHICRICGKAAKNIRNHEYLHERTMRKSNYQYRCHLCTKKFSTSINLENHLLMHKDGFKCDRCDEVFARPSELTRHKVTKHRPGSLCTVCDKVFHCKSNFYQHVLTHDGVRPYKCDVCGEDFTQRSSLLRHRRTHPGPLPPFEGIAHIADIAKKILLKHSKG